MLLADPAYTVPDPGPAGPYGTMSWLRATVSRFCEGAAHARRRAIAEELLAELDPEELRAAAARMSRAARRTATRDERQLRRAVPDEVDVRFAPAASGTTIDPPYVPVAALAAALGVDPAYLGEAVTATRIVAAAYHPHTSPDGADAALARLLSLLPSGRDEVVAARVAVLVQACEATAALVRGDDLPVPVTRRVSPDGETVLVELTDHPFGAGPRRCPGEAHARALVDGVLGR